MGKPTILAGFFALLFADVLAKVSPEVLERLDAAFLGDALPGSFNLTNVERLADHPHAHLNVLELATYYDYVTEKHLVTTEDGYILEVHRIPGTKSNPKAKGKPVVLLQHGLLCSSMDWVITGPKRGLGFLLADAGYDVWMGNARGNRYSLRHTNFTTDNAKFWEFSWHEIGKYDVPAMVDHILKKTGSEKISYIGHSQGSTTFFVMLSERPEYNDKISVMFSLAPVAYISHMTSPVFRALGKLAPFVDGIMGLLGRHEFKPGGEFFKRFAAFFCNEGNLSHPICTNVIFLICGYSEEQLDRELLPAILAHVPAGSSTKQFVHYAQLIDSGHFRQYNHGWFSNLAAYGSVTPPSYKFENVRVPVSLHYSTNDWLAHPIDVEEVHSKLPNCIGKFRVPFEKFNHLDYLWAKDVKHLLYDKIMSLLARYHK